MTDAGVRRCLSCYASFPPNDTLEHVPVGLRMAFDPARGRLWLICGACARWTLVPFESRWEALEELDRACAGRARLLKQGENVALYRFSVVDIIRVGRTGLHEEAWWRYGFGFLTRADRARAVVRRGRIVHTLIMSVITGLPIWGFFDPAEALGRARRARFGDVAWKGYNLCPNCGGVQRRLLFSELEHAVLETDGELLCVWLYCDRCGAMDSAAGHRWSGIAAEHVLRRALAFENFAGAGRADVDSAINLVDTHGGPEALVRSLARDRTRFRALSAPQNLASEMALNASLEDQLLGEEVADIEARWREEEELAAIIDGELRLTDADPIALASGQVAIRSREAIEESDGI